MFRESAGRVNARVLLDQAVETVVADLLPSTALCRPLPMPAEILFAAPLARCCAAR
jgi:hypothetical protein